MFSCRPTFLIFFTLLCLLFGCSRLRLDLIDSSVQKPSNVAVYFSMETSDGQPVGGLQANQFKVLEDGKVIPPIESKQRLLDQDTSVVRHTVLLLDMSGSVVESGNVPLIQEATGAFVENIGEGDRLAIYAFDGLKKIQTVAEFGKSKEQLFDKVQSLSSWETKDPSTNLNGAIIQSAEILQDAASRSNAPLKFGNLVIFTDSTDRANRASTREALRAIRDAEVSTYVIGLGTAIDQKELQKIGQEKFVHAVAKDTLVGAFKDIAALIKAKRESFYLLSYCSTSRAGIRELEIQAKHDEEKGRLSVNFDSDGFRPGCKPGKKPKFSVSDKKSKKSKAPKEEPKKKSGKKRGSYKRARQRRLG